jgi:hypothetical protein
VGLIKSKVKMKQEPDVIKKPQTASYDVVPDGTAVEDMTTARSLFGTSRVCKVVRHEVKVTVRYLVEYENGERQWRTAQEPEIEHSDNDDEDDLE